MASPTHTPDSDITDGHVARLRTGGVAAVRAVVSQWYEAHAAELLAFLAARTPDPHVARDLAQEVWTSVWSHAAEFDGRHLRGWLFQIARNKLIDWQRQRRERMMSDEIASGLTADEQADDGGRLSAIRPCVEQLDPSRRQVVEARLRGESFDFISQQSGTPVKTAMTQFHRAKQQLKECIERRMS